MRRDLYNIRQGKMFAIEMIAAAPGNLSVQPIIASLLHSIGNKPPGQQEGIREVIGLLEGYELAKPPATEQEPGFAELLGTLNAALAPREKGVIA